MGNLFTVQGADGRNLPSVQPVPGSVAGSPMSVTSGAAVTTPEITGMAVVACDQPMHVRFSKEGDAATSDDIFIPPSQWFAFPMDGDRISFLAVSTTGTVYVQTGAELSP